MTTRFTTGSIEPVVPTDFGNSPVATPASERESFIHHETASQHQVTSGLIDEAVSTVFQERGVDSSTAAVLKSLMAGDPNSGIAQAYYHGKASAGLARAHLAAVKRRIVVPYVLSDDEVTTLSGYAPEYVLDFKGQDPHDHPVAAASRMIDQVLVESKIPPGVRYTDIGGSPEHHAKQASVGVHICQPELDVKDPARMVQRRMRLKVMAADEEQPEAVREFAKKYLERDPSVVCGKVAQQCTEKTAVAVAVHVYDIPMADWPAIMERKGVRVVEGCMLFTPRIFDSVSGVMPAAGARYKVDPRANTFKMGFVNSPSWWYEHNWLEYCKYGVDQVLYGDKGAYSYKIVERRGDTIFFRIIPVAHGVPRNHFQTYRLPEVEMVEVQGFDVHKTVNSSGSPSKRVWVWPMPLWQDMMRHATEMIERGTLNHERMYNYYRTVAPRQTINAQRVAGGYTVPVGELVPLVVHVSLAAAASVYTSQEVSRQIIGSELVTRRRLEEYTIVKALTALYDSVKAAFGLVLLPAAVLGKTIGNQARSVLQQNLVEWAPRAVCTKINAKFLVTDVPGFSSNEFTVDEVDFTDEIGLAAPFDHVTAAMNDPGLASVLTSMFSSALPASVLTQLGAVVTKAEVDSRQDRESRQLESSETLVGSSVGVASKLGATPGGSRKDKTDAILEAIFECEMEQKKVQSSCAAAFRELCPGAPAVATMKRRLEEFRNPDFWWVEAGVVSKSVLGTRVDDFIHAAVFTPAFNSQSDSLIRPVFSEEFVGESQGRLVDRVHYVLSDRDYTGWVFVNDSLLVYNGPEIVSAMKLALDRPLDFSVKLVQGPPGCGKTTSIIQSFTDGCAVLCPGRMSTEETRGRLKIESDIAGADWKNLVRTLDSYLVNYAVSRKIKGLRPSRLLADEGFMSHAGKWYAAAALLGVEEVWAFGDQYQIPHVPRAEVPKMHLSIQPDAVEYQWLTYRCPPNAVAAWGHIYDWKVRSVSDVRSELVHVSSHRGLDIPDGCVMMGMYQADKKELRQQYSGCGKRVKIMTVHESQGKTFDNVWLHRFDRRKRSDQFSLYDKQPYVLVAMSRHTQSFKYICPDLDDLASKWIKQSKDPRRVLAAADSKSAGQTRQF